jgi:glucosamine kinase
MNRLLIDAGQSSIRLRRITEDTTRNRVLPPLRTDQELTEQVQRVILGTVTEADEGVTVAVAVSGLTNADEAASELLRGSARHGVCEVVATHDSITGYLGCLGEDSGVVAAVGTGVVTLAVGRAGFARVDGWGNIMGDAGSGYWIGRAGLEAAMRAHDGRGSETVLLNMLQQDFVDVEHAYIELQQDPDRISRVASYAKKLLTLAESDAVAGAIADSAADELAVSVSAALTRAGWVREDSPAIAWTGGIMASPRMASRLASILSRDWPAATIVAPRGEPIDGVALLPDLSPHHPLSGLVSRVTLAGVTR